MSVYVYEVKNNNIKKSYEKYNTISEACSEQNLAWATFTMLKDTNVSFRGKFFYTNPIKDFELTNDLIKSASIGLKLDNNIAVQIWAYDAKTLQIIDGSPFASKTQAGNFIGISRDVINYFLNTGKQKVLRERIYILDSWE